MHRLLGGLLEPALLRGDGKHAKRPGTGVRIDELEWDTRVSGIAVGANEEPLTVSSKSAGVTGSGTVALVCMN